MSGSLDIEVWELKRGTWTASKALELIRIWMVVIKVSGESSQKEKNKLRTEP